MEREKALEIVKEYYPSSGKDLNEALETLIPELKENEDEMIRNRIIGYLKQDIEEYPERKERIEEMLACLEKQDEQKSVPFKAEHGKYYYCIKDYFSGGKKQASKGDVVQALRGLPIMGLNNASEFFLPVNDMPLNNGIDNNGYPKFRVGDWIIRSAEGFKHDTYLVTEVKDYYVCEELKGRRVTFTLNDVHKNFKLWDISDAKDGDVLITKNKNIFIFKSISNCVIYDYCGLYFGNFIEYSAAVNNPAATQLPMDYVPATKEQCDLLFQKMKEEGYEWDAEKKELRKIEHKHPDIVEQLKEHLANTPKEQLEKEWKELEEYGNVGPTVKEFLHGEQKPTGWTEEDEQTVRFYEAYTNNQVGDWPQNKVLEMKSKFNDWVKKVKYRVQPQWKPSKEQLTALEHVSSEYVGSWQPEMLTLFDDLKTLYDNHNKNKK